MRGYPRIQGDQPPDSWVRSPSAVLHQLWTASIGSGGARSREPGWWSSAGDRGAAYAGSL